MTPRVTRAALVTLVVGLCVACSPTTSSPAPPAAGQPATSGAPSAQSRTLVVAIGRAPESLGSKPLRELRGPGSPDSALRAFNAGLAPHDAQESPRPYLVEALPQLNTDTWRV